ncbi:Aldo-keto reductase YhdN [subsurface metagenome]
MRTRKLGYTGVDLTVIGFGAWAIGGGGWLFSWGPQDDRDSIAAIHRALEDGVNWIDTAAVYGLGHSEEVVGRALKGIRDEVFVATKCGRLWDEEGRIYDGLGKESIRQQVEASLRRLDMDVIDLFQIHWPKPDEDIEEGWGAIAEMIGEGKIRYGGVSNFSVEQLKRVQAIHPVASLQPPYSMLVRGVEDELLDFCPANDIGVIVYSPMQKGLLTGKFTLERVENLLEDDHRRNDPHFREPEFTANLDFVESLRPIAEKNDATLAQLALGWVLRRSEVTAAIVGTRKASQIDETAKAGDMVLSEEDIIAIEELLGRRDEALGLI